MHGQDLLRRWSERGTKKGYYYSTRRGLPRERVAEIAQGKVYSGERARNLGLVDELGTLEDAIAYARAEAGLAADAPVEYRNAGRRSWFQLMSGMLSVLGTGD